MEQLNFKIFKNFKTKHGKFTEREIPALLFLLPEQADYTWENGYTKLVIIPKNSSYVYKIPFSGIYDSNQKYVPFDYDYCYAECVIYEMAKKYHLESFFAENKLLYNFKNQIKIYRQLKCTFAFNETPLLKIDTLKTINEYQKIFNDACPYSKEWLYNCIIYHGKDKTYNFLAFQSDNYLDNDMHNKNYGYCGSRPCLFDYGGFKENVSFSV